LITSGIYLAAQPPALIAALLYVALGAFCGASVVAAQVARGRRKGSPLRSMLRAGAGALFFATVATAWHATDFPTSAKHHVLLLATTGLALVHWLLDRKSPQVLFRAVAAPSLALLCLFTLLLWPGDSAGAGSERTFGLVLHVLLAVVGLIAFTFAASMGGLYLWQIRLLKTDPSAALTQSGPSLDTLDRINFRAVVIGFPFLALSVLGGWLFVAKQNLSFAEWAIDPTVIAALAGLLVYLALFFARGLLGWYGRRIAWLTVLGFLFVVVGSIVAGFCTSDSVMHQ
jgi:ABC-type uncharacterized transport system permease subunit